MSLHPVILLVLVLCLGWKINTQEGELCLWFLLYPWATLELIMCTWDAWKETLEYFL
uniref:Isoform 3 of Leukocyte-associated immunoglobulin-like receptor 1 n=1 Tax=Mus musculus TaxID=10090 RepID=Q8BG84-3